MDLLQHNRTAYESVVNHLKTTPRTCVIHPTGTGKSYIALQLIEDNPDARILYITSLATNLLEFWNKVEGLGGRRMALNLSNIPKYAVDEDGLTDEERQDLLKKATEVDESFLEGPLVQFCLYAGLENLLPDYDFILFDEFHRAGAPQWEKKVARILDENETARIVGFSATPVRMDGRDMRVLFNNDVASEMELSTAIIERLLPLPIYWLGNIEFDEIVDEEGFRESEKQKEKRTKGYPIIAKRHLEAGTGLREAFQEALTLENAAHGKFIVFCRTIKNVRVLKRLSEGWFDWAGEVHRYEMHTQDRYGFNDFVADDTDCLRLLFVVDMLTEGVHLEDLDGVIMVRPTESERIYFQQLGRALAVTTKREHPLIFDIVSNAAVMKGGMDFFKGIGKEMHLDEDDLGKFFHITAEAADFLAYLEEAEYDYYGAMKAFYEENGHLYMEPGYEVDGHDVYGEFCKIRGRKNQLAPEFRKKYEDIGMDWEITSQWMKGFMAASDYFAEFESLDVPSTIGEYHGVWLYDWVKRNRDKQDQLCERQHALLDSIGMDWEIKDPWEEMFDELAKYREKNGHCDVPGEAGRLGKWVTATRKNPPKGEKKKRLDTLDFEWDGRASRSRNAWRAGVAHAREYYELHGDLNVPGGFVTEDGYKLGIFVKNAKRDGRYEELEKVCGRI